jgi:hypothetical protein
VNRSASDRVVRRWGIGVLAALVLPLSAAVAVGPAPAAAAVTSTVPGTFEPVTPARVLDTRHHIGTTTDTPIPGGTALPVQVLGVAGIPTTGVMAVTVTVTAVGAQAAGWLSVLPDYTGQSLQGSQLNWAAGETVANSAIVQVGTNGRISVFNGSPQPTHVLVDVSGYWRSSDVPITAGGAMATLYPYRKLDTRAALGVPTAQPLAGGSTTKLFFGPRDGLGNAPAAAVVLNVTSTSSTSAGYLSLGGPPAPGTGASVLNWRPGRTVANLVVAPLAADGSVTLYVGAGARDTTHLIVDLFEFVLGGPQVEAGTITVDPAQRVLDTRHTGTPLPAGGPLQVMFTNPDGTPRFTPGEVSAVVVNVTVVAPRAGGWLTAYASGTPRPATSNLNFPAGQTIAAAMVVPVSSDGSITLWNAAPGTSDVIVDLEGVVRASAAPPPAAH